MAEWIMGHMGFAHLFKATEGTERVAMCSRVLTVFPDDKIEPWTLKCQYCELAEIRMKENSP
jgi:hypothetical protein